MTPCRVLVATPDFPPDHGGIQYLTYRLVAHFEAASPRVCALEADGAAEWDCVHGIDVRRVPVSSDQRMSIARLNAAVIAEAVRSRPDVLLAMHIGLAPAVTVVRRLLGTPTVTYVHADEVVAFPLMAHVALRHSTRIIAVSRYTSGLAVAARADDASITVIPPGIDWVERPLTPRDPRPTIVTVARLEDRYKGHEVIMRALPIVRARVPDVQWMVVGDGSLRGELERLTVSHGVDDEVHFFGAVSDRQRDRVLDRAHVFAMPSRVPPGGGKGSGSSISRRAFTAFRSSPAASAARSTRSSTRSPACSWTRATTSRLPVRSFDCWRTDRSPLAWVPPRASALEASLGRR